MQRPKQDPSALAWLLAFVSLLLPWGAALIALSGVWRIANGESAGYWQLALAAILLIADTVLDKIWSHPDVLPTDQPDLNRRPAQLIGRVLVVEEPIVRGRGKARVGDTLWEVEGADASAGTQVRVTGAKGAVLRVEPI